MRIIARYITKEILVAFGTITFVLFFIILSNRLGQFLAKAATGEFPISLVFELILLYTPEFLSYLIPLGFFIAILFGYGRLYADSEMNILAACGISTRYIVRLTLSIAFILMLITAWLSLWAVPRVTLLREKILSQGAVFGMMQSLLPQQFHTFSEGKLIVYAEETDPKKALLRRVFIVGDPIYFSQNRIGTLISAEKAQIKQDPKSDHFYLLLKNGQRYTGTPGEANYNVATFKEYERAVYQKSESTQSDILRIKKTKSLFRSSAPPDIAELQWRLSLALTVPILALIAIPLAHVRPRQGRFAKFLPAILIYIVYYNLFTVSRRWVENGTLPGFIGVWWVHALFLLVGVGLLMKNSGVRR
jgi:lipopolysaccharide export system permease protein